MSNERDLLKEAFERHDKETPDVAEVYAQVQRLAKGYRLRRWGVQAAGGAVLGAGLIAGGLQLPQFLPGNSTAGNITAAAPASQAPSGAATDEQALDAYTEAGYGYDEAMRLAELWKRDSSEPYAIKVEAGRQLLEGKKLPVAPMPDPTSDPGDTEGGGISDAESRAVDKFYDEGFGYADAIKLAKLWKLDGAYEAKVAGGERLLDGKKLPITHTPDEEADPRDLIPPGASAEEAARSMFWNSGYDGDDAAELAKIWKMDSDDLGAVKLRAGRMLLDGQRLPIRP